MKNYYLAITAILILASCQQTKKEDISTEETAVVEVVNSKYVGEEPTTPEATEIYEPVPPRVTVDTNGVPSDAIVLFDGSNLDEWIHVQDSTAATWKIMDDGSVQVNNKSGDIRTKRNFGSMQLHLEWKSPEEIIGEGQSRANSGVFIQQRYEVQVLDNNNNDTYTNGQVGALYKQSVPLAMASAPTGEWNTYDIIFHAPEFDGEELVTPAYVTVLHNGVLVQDHFEIEGFVKYIGWPEYQAHGNAPIQLQDHGDNSRVSYRNIWVREL